MINSQLKLSEISQEFPEIKSSTLKDFLRLSVEVKSFIFGGSSCYDVIDISGLKQASNGIGIRIQILLQVILDCCIQQKWA